MENDLYTMTLCQEDWELVIGALRVASLDGYNRAADISVDSIYGAALYDRAAQIQAIAADIDFILPE
jgi:hypothetical protein